MQAMMLVIDSKAEIRAAFAPEFPNVVLGDGEVMVNEETFEYLGVEVGTNLTVDF
jgi:hypothetical protein